MRGFEVALEKAFGCEIRQAPGSDGRTPAIWHRADIGAGVARAADREACPRAVDDAGPSRRNRLARSRHGTEARTALGVRQEIAGAAFR
jgi:hypothetical protein